MRVSTPDHRKLTVSQAHRALVDFLNKTQRVLDLDEDALAQWLDFSPAQLRAARINPKKLYASNLHNLLSRLDIDYDFIIDNRVDYSFLSARARGDYTVLPDRYSVGAAGKRRTIINILDYVEASCGSYVKAMLLRDFQLNARHFEDPKLPINNNFICDLLGRVKTYGFNELDIVRMGRESYYSNRFSDFGKLMSTHRTQKELFQSVFEDLIVHYDSNFHYQLVQISNNGALVRVRQNNVVADAMGMKKIGSKLLSISKIGVIQALPLYIGKPLAQVKLNRCTYEHDSYCEYEIEFSTELRRDLDGSIRPTIPQ